MVVGDHFGCLLMEELDVSAGKACQLMMEGQWRLGLHNVGNHPCQGMEL